MFLFTINVYIKNLNKKIANVKEVMIGVMDHSIVKLTIIRLSLNKIVVTGSERLGLLLNKSMSRL